MLRNPIVPKAKNKPGSYPSIDTNLLPFLPYTVIVGTMIFPKINALYLIR